MPIVTIPISVIRELVVGSEETTLKDDVAKAATSLGVKNNEKFSADQYVIIGKIGSETAEIRKIASTSTNETIVTDALVFDHAAGETITFIPYNQLRIYRADAIASVYTLLTTINLQVSGAGTSYNDTTGTSEKYYKFTYYNSTSTTASAYSDAIPGTGYTEYMFFAMTDDVAELIGDQNFEQITRKSIERKINHHQLLWWFSPYSKRELLVNQYPIVTDDDVAYVSLPANFDKLQDEFSVRYQYNDTASNRHQWLKPLSKADFWHKHGDLNAMSSDSLMNYWIDDSTSPKRLYIGPTPATASKNILIDYLKKVTSLVLPTDTTECPVPRLISLSVAIEILGLRGDKEKVDVLAAQRNQLLSGDVEHGRTQAGSQEMEFRKDYGKGRYNS